jgi:hypothetical protein
LISFAPLARMPRFKPVVAAWLLSEWPAWYGNGGPGDLDGDVDAFAGSELELPVGVVALDGTRPIGFRALKKESIPSHKHLSPWGLQQQRRCFEGPAGKSSSRCFTMASRCRSSAPGPNGRSIGRAPVGFASPTRR